VVIFKLQCTAFQLNIPYFFPARSLSGNTAGWIELLGLLNLFQTEEAMRKQHDLSSTTNAMELLQEQDFLHPHWYALYTRSRFEKKMLSELSERNVEVFLPMREVISRWKDRKKKIWMPLFPGYIFVNYVDTPENRYRILNIPGAVRFIGVEKHADPIPEEQIFSIRRFLEAGSAVDPYPYIQVGTRVEVIAGPMTGIRGILIEKRGKCRFVLQVDLIRQAVSVEIDASDVRPI
jgi:transcription antitermination factor NusG